MPSPKSAQGAGCLKNFHTTFQACDAEAISAGTDSTESDNQSLLEMSNSQCTFKAYIGSQPYVNIMGPCVPHHITGIDSRFETPSLPFN